MRKLSLLMLLALSACASVDQYPSPELTSFINATVPPGMPSEQALLRMDVEGFTCDGRAGLQLVTCTRQQPRMMRSPCVETVRLTRDGKGKTITAVDVAPKTCPRW
ncbi:hypothetical protein ACFOLJ_17095 [Rugamonas sp. CCM 8940]|uniref:hypothetical protein n=1 Tax=Rugamonas sp. CCM 8940 TaxID=2765359 RepID=UPI0018F6116E|nr:hypothetical protein [Rugamonas sp. CCM 8940]MBJ7308635.1 hypothetical protein [Rugamonas sp. CCM 8940]